MLVSWSVGTFCTDFRSVPSDMVSMVVTVFTSPQMLVDVLDETGTGLLVVVGLMGMAF